MTTLNQEAPPAEAPKGGFVKLEAFPKSDSYVLTLTAYNYIPSHPFEREAEDPVTKKKTPYIKNAPAVEFYFSGMIDGKPYHVKSWEKMYSLDQKATYRKWAAALLGADPVPGHKTSDLVGKSALVEIEVTDKVSSKGTKYKATNIKSVSKVPSILAATAVGIDQLLPALEAILKGEKDAGNVPF